MSCHAMIGHVEVTNRYSTNAQHMRSTMVIENVVVKIFELVDSGLRNRNEEIGCLRNG